MKVPGVTSPMISMTSLPSDTGADTGVHGGASQAKLVHEDAARHGVDAKSFIGDMHASKLLADFIASHQDGATTLRNAMSRQFGSALASELFNDQPLRRLP